jgi:hypothetical protein
MTQGADKPKKKSSLMRAFAKAATKVVLVLLATCSIAYGSYFEGFYAGRGAPLTAGETQMVQQVFGPDINVSKLRKHFRGEKDFTHCAAPGAGAMVLPPFSHIDFYGPNLWSSDYSKESEYKYSLFMHEATHTWQGQNWDFSLKSFGVYPYTLNARSAWGDFGIEQQADIIGDYAGRWLYPKNVAAKHSREDALLARVVENRFPKARESRLALEGKHPVDINGMIGPEPVKTGAPAVQTGAGNPKAKPSSSPYTFPFLTLCK